MRVHWQSGSGRVAASIGRDSGVAGLLGFGGTWAIGLRNGRH